MATTLTTEAKTAVLVSISSTYNRAILLNASGATVSDAAVTISLSTTAGVLTNSAPIVFNVAEGKEASKVEIYVLAQATSTIIIDLTTAPNTFTTAGTFTIPTGDLTITVA